MIQLPESWNDWTVEEKLGQGSYGTVYRIRHDSGKYAAVKVIHIPQNRRDANALRHTLGSRERVRYYYAAITKNFTREIELMNQLKGCPYIVAFDDYRVLPEGEGFSIYARMECLHPLPEYLEEKEVVTLGIHICSALEYCEQKKILHRDIKRTNILVSDEGVYKLCDFGVARAVKRSCGVSSVKGTFVTMAPEVYRGKPYDHRADLYSVGITMYMLLNDGREPFVDNQPATYQDHESALQRRMNGEVLPALALSNEDLSNILCRATAYNPGDRYPNAQELKNALIEMTKGTYLPRHHLAWQRRLQIIIFFMVFLALIIAAWTICYDNNICEFADRTDSIISPGKIRMIDHYQKSLGTVYKPEEIVTGAKNLEAEMIKFAGKDYKSFSKQFINTSEEQIRSNYKAFRELPEFPYYNWIPVYSKNDIYMVSRVGYGTEFHDDIFDEEGILYTIQKDGRWKNNDNDIIYEQMQEDLINKGYFPAGYIMAVRGGRSHFMYHEQDLSYLDSNLLFEGEADPYQLKFAWENTDGSMGIVFLFRDNREWPEHTVRGLHVRLSDKGGRMLIDRNVNLNVRLSNDHQILVYRKIERIEDREADWSTLNVEIEETGID